VKPIKIPIRWGLYYYANYLIWFEIGRGEFMRRCGVSIKDFEKEGIMLSVYMLPVIYIKNRSL
jgi:acyl-CoA thioester hydrolase